MSETRATTETVRPAGRRSVRRTLAAAALAVAATAGVGAAGTGVAAAAGPNYLPYYGSSATFPTWVWGSTAFCAENESSYRTAKVEVRIAFQPTQYVYVKPGNTGCIYPWGWGETLKATNVSYAPVTVWTN